MRVWILGFDQRGEGMGDGVWGLWCRRGRGREGGSSRLLGSR